METLRARWTTRYLRVAGSFSACTSVISFLLLLFALREDTPQIKLYLAIAGLLGTFMGYSIGKDITDRLRNHEEAAEYISTIQAKLAWLGTRFGKILFLLFGLTLLIWTLTTLSTASEWTPLFIIPAFPCLDVLSQSEI